MDGRTIRILFLGGAKRVSMARLFKQAASRAGMACEIFSYETDRCVPIACEATVVEGRRWADPDIQRHLHETVAQYHIDIIVPFVDGAVAVAANYAAAFPGEVFVPTGSAADAELMFDKVLAAEAFERAGLPAPRTYRPGDPCMRLIAKPRHGSASKGIVEISSVEALDDIMLRRDDYLIQKRIDNREELTVDCYVSVAYASVLAVSPRRRNVTVGGEVSDTVTVDMPEAVDLTVRTLHALGLRGAVTVQLIRDLDDEGRLMIMEINPRLGGGAVCSVIAGADIPAMIIAEALGHVPMAMKADPDVRICRYMQEVVFSNNVYQKQSDK